MKKRDLKEMLRTPEPSLRTATPAELETRGAVLAAELDADRRARPSFYWPKGKPRPRYSPRPLQPFHPCTNCDRVKTDGGQRAVVFDAGVSLKCGKAYGRCRCCGSRVAVPIELDENSVD